MKRAEKRYLEIDIKIVIRDTYWPKVWPLFVSIAMASMYQPHLTMKFLMCWSDGTSKVSTLVVLFNSIPNARVSPFARKTWKPLNHSI